MEMTPRIQMCGNALGGKRSIPSFYRLILLLSGLIVVLLVHAQPLRAQDVSVSASVDQTTIGTQDRLTYGIEVKGGQAAKIDALTPPNVEGLRLAQSFASTSQNISIVNGRMEQSIRYEWIYVPTREGTVNIPSVSVKVGKKTYRTKPITVKVVPQSHRPARRGPDPLARLMNPFTPAPDNTDEPDPPDAQNLFIRVVPSARKAYQNEQITVEYQLFFREGIQLRQSRLTDSWDAEGFWREEMDVDTRPIPRSVVENGLRYNTIVLKRAAVFPTHPGKLHVDPLRIETEAVVPTRSRDPFARFFSSSRFVPVNVASDPLTIETRALPDNPPAGFNGAVGQYRMTAKLDRSSVEIGWSIQVKIVVSGAGNLATLAAPVFPAPGSFEQYDPQVETSINRTGREIRGTKTFTYVLVPRSHGTFELPPARFVYFDPKDGRYQVQSTTLPVVHVTGDDAAIPAAGVTSAGLPVDDIAEPLVDGAVWRSTHRTPLHESPWTYAWLVLPLLALGGLSLYQQRTKRLATDRRFARNRRAHPLARKHLKRAEALLRKNEPRAFYADVERAVLGFIGNRLNIAETGLTRIQIDQRLAEVDVPQDVRIRLAHLLEECDRVRFAPVLPDEDSMQTALDRAGQIIVDLDASFKQTVEATGE